MKNLSEFGETHGVSDIIRTGQSRAKQVDLAWLAGIVDGEGYIGACHVRGNFIKSQFCVNNCSLRMLYKVQMIVEQVTGRKYRITQASNHKGRNYTFFEFRIGDQAIIAGALRAIIPYLVTKKEQAKVLASFCESRRGGRGKRTGNRFFSRGYTDEEKSVVETLKRLKTSEYIPHPARVETKREAPDNQGDAIVQVR